METATSVLPLLGYVTLKLLEPEKITASGLELPDSSQEKPQFGKVIAIGKSVHKNLEEIKCPVKVGDTVVFKKFTGNVVKIKDKEVQLVEFENLMGVIE